MLDFFLKGLLPQKGKARLINHIINYNPLEKSLCVSARLNRYSRYFINSLNSEMLIEVAAQASILLSMLNGFNLWKSHKSNGLTLPKNYLLTRAKITKIDLLHLWDSEYMVKVTKDSELGKNIVFNFECYLLDNSLSKNSFLEGFIYTQG